MPTRSLALAFCFICWIWTDLARSQPTAVPLGPKETLKTWNFVGKTVDEVLPWYQANTNNEKKLARACATQALSTTRLSEAVKAKWGQGVETIVAHLCLTETHEDDDAATVAVDGNEATLDFGISGVAPLFLVQTGVIWRVDMAAYMRALGSKWESARKYCDESSVICDKMTADVIGGKYPTAGQMIDALKKALAPLAEQ